MKQNPSPPIICILGLPGSGKSYFASRFAKRLEAVYISSDKVRKEMIAQPTYTREEKAGVYQEMVNRMQKAISENKQVVVDSTFFLQRIRQQFLDAAREMEKQVFFIEIQANDTTTRKRLQQERPDSDADYTVYLKLKARFEPLELPHLVLHSDTADVNDMIEEAIVYIQEP